MFYIVCALGKKKKKRWLRTSKEEGQEITIFITYILRLFCGGLRCFPHIFTTSTRGVSAC